MSWVADFFEQVQKAQANILSDFSEEERKKGYGFAAKVIVDGPNGGVFNFWFCEQGIRPKPADIPIRNVIYLTEDTLLDLITPDISFSELLKLVEREGVEKAAYYIRPRLSIRQALANRLIRVSGEKADIDTEVWSQILDKTEKRIFLPIAIRGIVRKMRRGK